MSTETSPDPAYHGTRGASGSSSSEDAAQADLVKGVTNATQRLVLILAAQAGAKGVTVAELRENKTSLHHGRISSALTKHHIAGRLIALHERRGHCGVYVLPEFVNGRTFRPYHRAGKKPIDPEIIVGVLLEHEAMTPSYADPFCRCGWGVPGAPRSITMSISPAPQHRQHLAEKIAEVLNG